MLGSYATLELIHPGPSRGSFRNHYTLGFEG